MPGLTIGGINIKVPDNISIGSGGDINFPLPGSGGLSGDHIPAQNQAGAELANIVSTYNQLRAAGGNTTAAVQQLVQRVNTAIANFATVVNQVNTSRARAGLADIQRLSGQVIASMVTTSGSPVSPEGYAYAGGGIISGIDNSTLLLVGAGLFLFLRKR